MPSDDDVVELEALRGVGGGKGQRRIVPAQLGERARGRPGRRWRSAGEIRWPTAQPRSAVARLRSRSCRRRSTARTRPSVRSSGSPGRASVAARVEQRVDQRGRRGAARSAAPGTGARARGRRRRPGAARGSCGRAPPASSRRRARSGSRARGGPSRPTGPAARTSAPGRRRPGPDRLREPLAVVLDEPDGSLDDLAGAAVVDLQVDPAQAGQERLEAEDPPDVGQSPAVDRLVVVADEEDPVGRCGEQQGQPKLRPVDVLDLVDEQLPAATAPAGEQRRVAFQRVRSRAGSGRRSRGRRSPRRRPRRPRTRGRPARRRVRRDVGGRDAQLDLEPRDRRVESEQIGLVGPGRDRGEDRRAIGERLDRRRRRRAGSRDPERGTSGPAPLRARRRAVPRRHRVARSSRPRPAC